MAAAAASNVFTNIHAVNQAGLAEVTRFTIETGGNQIILGPSGTGKTEINVQCIESMGYEFVYLNLSVLEAPDLLGLPSIDEKEMVVKYALPAAFPKVKKVKDGENRPKGKILLVDELDKSKPELQAPMLELFQYRSINGQELGFDAVLATGNRPDEGAFSMPINKALTNRCKVYQMNPEFDPWRDWAASVNLNGLVIGFLSRNKDLFFAPDKSGDMTAYCSCSPRSWSNAARDLDFAHKSKSKQNDWTFQNQIVSGYVGVSAAAKFEVWLTYYKEIYPLIDALVLKGVEPNLKDATMDKVIVMAIAASQEIANKAKIIPGGKPDKQAILEAQKVAKNVSTWLAKCPVDVMVAGMKSTLTSDQIQDYKITEVGDFMKVFRAINAAYKNT